jgi:dienelactone hydrolase
MSSEAISGPPTAGLEGWTEGAFEADGIRHPVFEKGAGAGVVLVPELPGLTPEVLGLAQHLVDSGFTVVVPSPFGTPGRSSTLGYTGGTVLRLCVSAEFRAFAIGASRPFSAWLRALARDLAARTPGRGVGVIGMCFTGNFALAAAVDDAVLAPVLSQPAVPFPLGKVRKADPGVSPAELDVIRERVDRDGLCLLGLRFSEDPNVRPERFAAIRAALGDAFGVITLDSSPGNAGGFSRLAHSVLTDEVRATPGHPALQARERVVEFLRERLVRG